MDKPAVRGATRRLPIFALFLGDAVSLTGNALASVAIPWFVLQTTGSAAKTGITFAAITLGNVLAGFFAGPLVDRLGHKRTGVLTDLVSGATVALVPLLYSTVGLAFWQLLGLVFLGAVVDMPGYTARRSLLPRLAKLAGMPKERANSADQFIRQMAYLVGPPIAGVLVVVIGATGVLWINASTFLISAAVIILGVPALAGRRRASSHPGPRGYLAELREGLGFLRSDKLLFTIVTVAVGLNFLANPLLTVVLVFYAERTYGDPASFGLMLGAFGGGTLLSSVLFGAFGHRLPRRATFSVALVAQSLPIWTLAFSPPLVASVMVLAIMGLFGGPLNPLIFTIVQERTPEELLGRVTGAAVALAMGAAPLGAALAGWLLGVVGTAPVIIAIAAGLLALSLGLVLNPILRGMDAIEGR
jgi:MFS family permease